MLDARRYAFLSENDGGREGLRFDILGMKFFTILFPISSRNCLVFAACLNYFEASAAF